MRIFLFITKSEQGGAQTHVAQLAEYFLSRSDAVAIMSAPGGWLENEAKRLGVTFYPNTFLRNTADPLRLWRAHKTFQKSMIQFHPDIVACHSTIAGLIGRLSLRKKIPTVFTAHGWGFTQGTPFLRQLILPFLEKLTGIYANKIICVSQNDLTLATQKHIASTKKLVLIHNGVKIPNEIQKTRNSRPVLPAGRPDPILRIIFVGRLAAPKEPLRLIEAFMNLPKNMQHVCSLNIVGNGPQLESLKKFVQEKKLAQTVHLLGNVQHDQIISILHQADIFVLPTRWEGFPYTILEAMSCSLPVIATDVGGISEAIDEVGILIPKKNTQALTTALMDLIEHPEKRECLGKAGYDRVCKKFSVQMMCEKTRAVYASILKSD